MNAIKFPLNGSVYTVRLAIIINECDPFLYTVCISKPNRFRPR